MSGLEVLGVVASILQIADLGAKLSVKLCTFYRTVKAANQSMQDLSCDVSLTCSILNELAKALEQDDQAKLCSKQAFCIAQEVLQECKAVFQQIENAIEKHNQDGEKNCFTRGARKVTVALLGPNLDVLKSNLERLKSTTLLMLHVIMYAGELRKRKVKSTLIDQRNLIHTLLEEKKANTSKFDQLSSSIQAFGICDGDGSHRELSGSLGTEKQLPPLSMELRKYHTLVQRLLCEIDACQYSLEESRHLRIRNGIVNIHSTESVLFQHTHGHAATQIFDDPFFKFRDACFPAPVTTREQSLPTRETRNAYSRPSESDYDVVRSSDVEEDPDYYHRHRRVREYYHPSRRKLDPGGSISQASRRGGNQDQDYSSDDSMAYIRKETLHYEDHPHHRRHMAEGALVDAGATELLHSRSKKDGEVSYGASRVGKTLGAGALSAVTVNAASHARDYYHRSKSRHRSHSFEDDRSSHRHSRHGRSRHSRSRSRSHSHSRAKILLEVGVGSAAMAAGVSVLHSKSNSGYRKSRSRTRSRSRAFSRGRSEKGRENDDSAHSMSERRKHIAGARLAGAAVAGLVDKVRSRSRSRNGERSRSKSRLKQDLPICGAGLATAAATGLYENRKCQKDEKDGISRGQHRSRSRSRAPSQVYPDPSRDSAGLVEYGNDAVTGSIPAEHYYRQPVSPGVPYDVSDTYVRRSTCSRSRSREGRYSSSSGSDREDRRRHRSKKHRSRSREISSALGPTGIGYAAHKYSQHKDRRNPEERELFGKKESTEVSRKRFRSCSDDDDAPRGRTRTRYNQDLISHAVSDVEETARGDGQSEEEDSSHKCRRMKSPYRELEKSAEYDKVHLGVTMTPETAKEDISLPSPIDREMEETLEGLVLQWTNLTREEIQIE
ncbi:unnamed protein product [Penicillium nalgiovense]|uniref:DUF3824 domain-containing protein n=1 Tax=Penicillium nalgiovense TaxID=60175 RepID=A0A9W4HG63_PENNA|nr:unnamed protein product [Penicillium nalgiovense]CAG7968456.1 unnamed protein product [Penicillium nalgiovense]CAG7971879.1 unnamed protein product [Penicillium nalgiovense]CAG7973759.1 unnamed protein product [Penicillium nalgiovense]CAG7978874.1 unnamed protein product [Penicillium nalgiovense]